MATDPSATLRTGILPSPPSAEGSPQFAAIAQLLQPFTGNQFRYLLAFLRDPEQSHAVVAKAIGVTPETAYGWRYEVPGFKAAMDTIRAHRPGLRSEYAKLAFDGAIPDLVDAMIQRGKGQGRDSQRAGERILEQQGVLQKEAPIVITDPSRDMLAQLRTLTALAMGQAIEVQAPEAQEQAQQAMAKVLGPGEIVEEGDEAP